MIKSLMYRLGRKLYSKTREDLPNFPESNGEYWLLENIIPKLSDNDIIFDIGANKGEWTNKALQLTNRLNNVRIFAFEPSNYTRSMLTNRFINNSNIKIFDTALSNKKEETNFFINAKGSGTN